MTLQILKEKKLTAADRVVTMQIDNAKIKKVFVLHVCGTTTNMIQLMGLCCNMQKFVVNRRTGQFLGWTQEMAVDITQYLPKPITQPLPAASASPSGESHAPVATGTDGHNPATSASTSVPASTNDIFADVDKHLATHVRAFMIRSLSGALCVPFALLPVREDRSFIAIDIVMDILCFIALLETILITVIAIVMDGHSTNKVGNEQLI